MDRLLVATALVIAAVALAVVLQRRRPEPPTQRGWSVPAQLDRSEFPEPDKPWLVTTFTSATCDTCAGVAAKAEVLASAEVAVFEAELGEQRDLHRRYRIEAVPTLVIADEQGVVRASFVGPVTATDLWATVAEVRSPGTLPPDGCSHGLDDAPGEAGS